MPNLSLESIKMQNFNGENLYPALNARVYRVARQTPESRPNMEENFGKIFYRVMFKVKREVSLVGLEFFGPSTRNFATYRAEVAVSWTKTKANCCLPTFRTVDLQPYHVEYVQARRGENFVVRFPQPAVVPPYLWVDIKFQLEGPNTQCKYFCSSQQKVFVDGQVDPYTFDFLSGSHQLAALHFIV